MDLARLGSLAEVAAVFTFGREDVIPTMFSQLLQAGGDSGLSNYASTKKKHGTSNYQKGDSCNEINAEFVFPTIIQKVELDLEEDWKNWLKHPCDNTGVVAVFKLW